MLNLMPCILVFLRGMKMVDVGRGTMNVLYLK